MRRKERNKWMVAERHVFLFRQVGFILALLLVIGAFKWTTYERSTFSVEPDIHLEEESEIADITSHASERKPITDPPIFKSVDKNTEPTKANPEIPDPEKPNEGTGYDERIIYIDPPPEPDPGDNEIHVGVEDEPEFPGGYRALRQFLTEKVRYPSKAREMGVQGRVFVTFIVERDGSITSIQIRENAGVHPLLDEEAKRVIAEMPNWIPGKQQGRPVRVRFNIPIVFRLH